MSSISRLLHRNFWTAAKPRISSAAATATLAAAAAGAATKSRRGVFSGERSLKRLVEKFKKACESDRFRTKIGVYEKTVLRLAAVKKFQWVEEILEEQKKYPDMSKEGFAARIISLYGKVGMLENAQQVFDEIPERNCKRTVLSFNALLGAYVSSRNLDKIEEVFRDLPAKLSIEPDLVSYNTFIKALCEKSSLSDAICVLDEIETKGLEPDIVTFNTLLSELYVNGQFKDGEEIWGQMLQKNIQPNTRSYNARLFGLATETKSKELGDLFEEMKVKGVKPDVYSFTTLIRGFINEGKADEAKMWYGEMEKNGCRPNKVTYAMLLPFLCEKGDLEFAFDLCKKIFSKRRIVDQTILQHVVNELVKGFKIREAEEIVRLGKTNDYLLYKLDLPSRDL